MSDVTEPMEAPTPRTLDVAALRGLGHPLRIALLETLSAYGPNTASGLADRLDESSGATSYHLRQLEKHGFVREVDDRGTARERWWERVPGPIRLPDSDSVGGSDVAARSAAELIANEWERSRHRMLLDYMCYSDERFGPEWNDHTALSTMNLRLTVEEFQELSARLDRAVFGIAEEYRGRATPGSRPVQLHLNLFPLADGVPLPDPSDETRVDAHPRDTDTRIDTYARPDSSTRPDSHTRTDSSTRPDTASDKEDAS